MTKRTPSKHEMRNQTQRVFAVTDMIAKILMRGLTVGALVAIFYFADHAVESLSGQKTEANFGLKVLGNISINHWLCYLLAGGTGFWATQERALRQRKVAELGERIKNLEKQLNSGRTSSMLPPSGTTRTDD